MSSNVDYPHANAHTYMHTHTYTRTHTHAHTHAHTDHISLGRLEIVTHTQTSCHTYTQKPHKHRPHVIYTHTDLISLGRLCGGLGVRREFRSFSKVPVDCDLFRWGCLQL